LSAVCDASNAAPIDGKATLATERFRFATAATRMTEARTSPAWSGALDAERGASVLCDPFMLIGAPPLGRHYDQSRAVV
jgi:hypothetical protein